MNKEELENEAEVCMHNTLFWLKLPISKENVKEGGSYILKLLEPREKQIEIDAIHIRALQKQNGELTDKVNNLEEKLANADYQLEGRDNEIRELKEQIEKMKCCPTCDNNKEEHTPEEHYRCKTCKKFCNWELAD